VLWVYSASPHEQIREVREADLERWRESGSSENPVGATGGEQRPLEPRSRRQGVAGAGGLRLTDAEDPGMDAPRDESEDRAGSDDPTRSRDSGVILTDEELEMLLSDDPPEEDD
jgi:hypothetical protein